MPNKEGKRKRGGQPKYPGEEQQRLSVLMRPRYKQALELLAKERQTTLSEAAEFAIAYMARKYEIEEIPLINLVRPYQEPFQLICTAIFEWGIPTIDDNISRESIIEWYYHYQDKPEILKSSEESFFEDVLIKLIDVDIVGDKINGLELASYYLKKDLFYKSVVELRKQAYLSDEIVELVVEVTKFLGMYHYINYSKSTKTMAEPIFTEPLEGIETNWMTYMENEVFGQIII